MQATVSGNISKLKLCDIDREGGASDSEATRDPDGLDGNPAAICAADSHQFCHCVSMG